MTDFSQLLKADRGEPAIPLHLVNKRGFADWLKAQPAQSQSILGAQGFKGEGFAIFPGDGAEEWSAVVAVADAAALDPWSLAGAADRLPAGAYRLVSGSPGAAGLGWLLAQHRFDRYKKTDAPDIRVLFTTEAVGIARTLAVAEAVSLVRDLIDTPATDMGPQQIEEAAADVAARFGAQLDVTRGDALSQGYPMIAAVGRAADRAYAPRLIEMEWGKSHHPRVAIVGKGVSFDSGGLDIKPASGMRLMKKDMGGAAHALALAQLVMRLNLPVRLHLLIPAAENAISGNAFRPGDVLASRAGLTVEVHNTDAEGRLLLGDALTRASENSPDLIIDFATLTGAARVALGPELPALFANDDILAQALLQAGKAETDPLWRLPLWAGYDDMLKSDVADIANASDSPFAGAVTAALFLRRFVPEGMPWAHVDTFGWNPADKPGRPKGGEALGLRAAWHMLEQRYAGVQ